MQTLSLSDTINSEGDISPFATKKLAIADGLRQSFSEQNLGSLMSSFRLDQSEFNLIKFRALKDANIDYYDPPEFDWFAELFAWTWLLGGLLRLLDRKERALRLKVSQSVYRKWYNIYRDKIENETLSKRERYLLTQDYYPD